MIKHICINIGNIPAVIFGEASEKVIIAIHGSMSDKNDRLICLLAGIAEKFNYQVLSFDLPNHGERKRENTTCDIKESIEDIQKIMTFAETGWKELSLFACSIGAYFSLIACKKTKFTNCLFVSPVTDLLSLIKRMMTIIDITPEKLEEKKEIPTSFGQTLYWDYYSYVEKHPVKSWKSPTSILCAEHDEICGISMIENFARRFNAKMTIIKSKHYIHTKEEIKIYREWVINSLTANK